MKVKIEENSKKSEIKIGDIVKWVGGQDLNRYGIICDIHEDLKLNKYFDNLFIHVVYGDDAGEVYLYTPENWILAKDKITITN